MIFNLIKIHRFIEPGLGNPGFVLLKLCYLYMDPWALFSSNVSKLVSLNVNLIMKYLSNIRNYNTNRNLLPIKLDDKLICQSNQKDNNDTLLSCCTSLFHFIHFVFLVNFRIGQVNSLIVFHTNTLT